MSEDELNTLASALRALIPTVQPLDRDALMYRVGRASVPRQGWFWPSAAAAASLFAVGFGIALVTRPPQVRTVERVVVLPAPVPAPTPPIETPTPPERPAVSPLSSPWAPPASRYDQVRDNVLRWGLDGLPPAPTPAPKTRHEPITASELVLPF